MPAAAVAIAPLLSLMETLTTLREELQDFEHRFAAKVRKLDGAFQSSASNLLHYVGLRRHDLRQVQQQLTALGLSSLGRSEEHVLATLDAVLGVLARLSQVPGPVLAATGEGPSFASSKLLAAQHLQALLGPDPPRRRVRIMVTLPESAAEDYALVRSLVQGGMDCARINCAHDDPPRWRRMVEHVRRASAEARRPCQVVMDLGGPKLRTGELGAGPQVIRWKPRRNAYGQFVAPARVWLEDAAHPVEPPGTVEARVPVQEGWQVSLRTGDKVLLRDARGKRRQLKIVQEAGQGRLALCAASAYVTPDTLLRHKPAKARRGRERVAAPLGRLGSMPAREGSILLRQGDVLVLTEPSVLGEPAQRDRDERVVRPAHIGCTLPEVLRDLRVGERVMLDDGKIGAVVTATAAKQVTAKVTQAARRGAALGANKGINLPDSTLHLAALTDKDLVDLVEIVRLADGVGYSFVRRPEDVHQLQSHLRRLGRADMPILLKIENRPAFENLPSLLLALMRSPVAGVMIARGDLAIEIGYERLAEVQEEILWMCEAAHMPVVWATQVLESLAKQGVPSRAEITDAAMGVRAECVMLNKGPYILEAIRALDNILVRMQEHHQKKREMLRRLKLAEAMPPPP